MDTNWVTKHSRAPAAPKGNVSIPVAVVESLDKDLDNILYLNFPDGRCSV